METCSQAHCFVAPTISFFFIAFGYMDQAPFGTHTHSWIEKRTGNQEKEKTGRDGRGRGKTDK